MDDMLSLLVAVGGLLLILGIGGALWNFICRIPVLEHILNQRYTSLPLGREEVQEISKERHSCKY